MSISIRSCPKNDTSNIGGWILKTLSLDNDEIEFLVRILLRLEQRNINLAKIAAAAGDLRNTYARRESAAKALRLAHKLGGAQ